MGSERLTLLAILAGLAALAAAGPRAWAAAPSVDVDRIEVTGVSALDRGVVESAMEIAAGDRYERVKVARTAENLQEAYRMRGYEDVAVQAELVRQKTETKTLETVLRFKVTEGLPTRVAGFRLLPQRAGDREEEGDGKGKEANPEKDAARKEVLSNWKVIEPVLVSRVGIELGDVFDQEKIAAVKRGLQESLASEEYIGARVDDVRVSSVSAPEGEIGKRGAARWVELEFPVDLGDRVTFGFRGNTVFTKARLTALVDEQRILGFGKDYVNLIRQRIEEEYRAEGYARARVTPYTFERAGRQERHVTFVIDEGPKVRIAAVTFDGNRLFSSEQLRAQFESLAPLKVRKGIYVEKDVEKAAELLIEWLKSQGYLFAKLITVNRQYSADRGSVTLVLYLYEGDQTVAGEVVVKGLTVFSPAEVRAKLGNREGRPLNLFAFNEGIEALKAEYRTRGYLGMKIANEGTDTVVQYSEDNREATIVLEVEEGPQYRVGRIVIEGLSGTREEIVRRELTFAVDEVLEEAKINDSEGKLRKLGIFSSVSIQATDEEGRPGFKVVTVSVQEGTPGVVGGGLGFRNDEGIRVFGQAAYTNVWKRNHTISLDGNLNRTLDDRFCRKQAQSGQSVVQIAGECFIEYRFQLSYVWPWIAAGETTFRPRVSVETRRFLTFDAQTAAFTASLERSIYRPWRLSGSLTYSLERTKYFNTIFEVDRRTLTIGSLTPSLQIDWRDNPLAPTRGFYVTSLFEVAHPHFLSQSDPVPVAYTRFQGRADVFLPLPLGITWYVSARVGLARNLAVAPEGASPQEAATYQIPLSKHFTLGGAGSLRGFGDQELNVFSTAIRGTLSYVNYRTQLDLPFAGSLRFGPFLDAGNLLVDFRTDQGIGMRYGAGFGFHYRSPVGPVNFDLGFKLHPRPDEDPYRFYFSIGVI